MYLADYHTHTRCSMDSQAPLSEEAEQAAALGLRELCTTDHCDLLDESGRRVFSLDWSAILRQYEETCARLPDRLKLRLGLELGNAQEDPACAGEILSGAPLDFVIGSVHNQSAAAGGRDLYYLDYTRRADCLAVLDDYFTCLERLAALPGCYDVLGHVIYPLRYMTGTEGGPVGLERHWDRLRSVLTAVVRAGRGIELNTYCGRTLAPWAPVLALYRECGGEIVTVGSDAHTPGDVGRGVEEAQALLLKAGFRYQAVYRLRTPQFVKL